MLRGATWVALVLGVGLVAAPVLAQETAATQPPAKAGAATLGDGGKGLGILGVCLGAGLAVVGGALGIGNIGARATESIARQPEAANRIFLAWLLPAAMIEGAMLFAVLVCFLLAMGNGVLK